MPRKKPASRSPSAGPPGPDLFLREMQATMALSLLSDPEQVAALAEDIASTPGDEMPDETVCDLLSTTLNEARMAAEGGQRAGRACLDTVERHLTRLSGTGVLTTRGCMAVVACYVRAGLPCPDGIRPSEESVMREARSLPAVSEQDGAAALSRLLGDILDEAGDDPSLLHQSFAENLPSLPPQAQYMLCRTTAANPDPRLETLAQAWLLDMADAVRSGALDGLEDRRAAGHLSARAHRRLAILRTWIADDAVRARVDTLIRAMLRSGATPDATSSSATRITDYVSSPIDGAGAQSFGIGLQRGRARSVACVLLKQGFGIKDAYIAPCGLAEQRNIFRQIAGPAAGGRVSPEYIRASLATALADGLENGLSPAPGLIDIVEVCALDDLRPASGAAAGALLDRYDQDGRIASLSAQARSALMAESGLWHTHHPVLESWFEDDDAIFDALPEGASSAATKKAIWARLETRRDYWSALMARTALLLGELRDPLADSYAAVAGEIAGKGALRRVKAMAGIVDRSLEARAAQQMSEFEDPSMAFDADFMNFLMEAVTTGPLAKDPASRGSGTHRKPARKTSSGKDKAQKGSVRKQR